MGYITDLINKAKGFLEDAKPPEETRAVHHNSFDEDDWQFIQEHVPKIRREMEEAGRTIDYVDDLFGDVHKIFHKVHPETRGEKEMAETHVANQQIIQTLQGMDEVRNLRQHSVGDTYGTAMSMVSMGKVLTETAQTVREARAEAEERARQAKEQREQNAAAIAALLSQMEGMPEDQIPGEMQQQLQQQLDEAGQAEQQQQEAQQQAQEAGEQAGQGMANALKQKAKELDDQLNEEADLQRAFGVEDGDLKRMSVEERMELAKLLRNNRLSQFAKLLGQFKMVQQAKSRQRIVNAATEIHGVTQSNDLSRMIASEYLNYADPSLETLMLLRFTEHQLNTYDVRGKEKMGQGPIICVVDESGSMGATDVVGGTREAWSKALTLALCDQARRRKRDFVYIGFSSPGQQHVIRFPGGVAALPKVIEMTEHFWGGGTHYEKPLKMALEIIETEFDATGKGRPDIVFMTDDEYGQLDADFMAEWNRIKDKASIQCYGIAIGCGYSGALKQVSDNVRAITEMVSDPSNVGDLFQTI